MEELHKKKYYYDFQKELKEKVNELPIESYVKLLYLFYVSEIEKLEGKIRYSREKGLKEIGKCRLYCVAEETEKVSKEVSKYMEEIKMFEEFRSIVLYIIEKYNLVNDNQDSVDYLKGLVR